jgi:hypothetical protein
MKRYALIAAAMLAAGCASAAPPASRTNTAIVVSLAWDNGADAIQSGAVSTEVARTTVPETVWTTVGVVPVAVTSLTNVAQPVGEYEYRARHIAAATDSLWSDPCTVTNSTRVPGKPSKPRKD